MPELPEADTARGHAQRCLPTAEGFLLDAGKDEDPQCPRCGAASARATIAGRTSR